LTLSTDEPIIGSSVDKYRINQRINYRGY